MFVLFDMRYLSDLSNRNYTFSKICCIEYDLSSQDFVLAFHNNWYHVEYLQPFFVVFLIHDNDSAPLSAFLIIISSYCLIALSAVLSSLPRFDLISWPLVSIEYLIMLLINCSNVSVLFPGGVKLDLLLTIESFLISSV